MKKTLLLSFFLLSLFGVSKAQAPDWLWAKAAGGAINTDKGNKVVADRHGNIYAIGEYNSLSFTLGSVTFNNTGTSDAFLVKYNSSGDVLWAKEITGPNEESINGLALDDNGNVYVTGRSISSTTGFGSSQFSLGGGGFFLAQYTANGSFNWVRTASGFAVNSSGIDVTVDGNGDCLVTGNFRGPFSLGGIPVPGGPTNDGLFVAKYDPQGNVQWAKGISSSGVQQVSAITADPNGSCYVTGQFESEELNFGTVTLHNSISDSMLNITYFLARYDAVGNVVWARTAAADSGSSVGKDLVADSAGNVYVLGSFNGSPIDFGTASLLNEGSTNFFLAKYDTTGALHWLKAAGGNIGILATGIDFDESGNVYFTGFFSGSSVSFGSHIVSSVGMMDVLVAKYDPTGNCTWVKTTGGSLIDNSNGVCVDRLGNSIIVGSLQSSFVPFGSTILSPSQPSGAAYFIAKLAPCTAPPLPVVVQNGSNLSVSGSYSSYQWYLNDNPIPGATGQTFTATQPGQYYVIVSNNSNCHGQSNHVNFTLGVSSAHSKTSLKVYPNPATDFLLIENLERSDAAITITIYDTRGVKVIEQRMSSNNNAIDIQSLAPGAYRVRIGSTSSLIIKQ